LNIPKEILQFLPYAGAGIFAYAIYFVANLLVNTPGRRYRRLAATDTEEVLPATFGSDQHKIRMAFSKFRMDVSGREKQARTIAYIAAGIIGFLFMRIGLLMSPLISVIGCGLGYLLVNTLIESSWKQVQMDIDSELPLFLTGFSSTVQIQQDKLTAVYEEAQTLNPEGSLRKWLLERFVAEYDRYGQNVFPELIKEAFGISNSLGVMMYMIQRFWIAGGDWGDAFVLGTDNLEGILDARISGDAQGANARSSILAIAGLLVVVIVIMTRNPTTREIISSPIMQLGYVGLFAWMMFGWKVMTNMINEAF
jgi:Flp pilus assembly protein TadB